MGAIGDYVHSTVGGYRDRTGKHSGPYYDTAATVIKKRQDMLDTWISKQGYKTKADDLQKSLNETLGTAKALVEKSNRNALITANDSSAQEILEDLQKILPKKYVRMDLVQSLTIGLLTTGGYKSGINNIAGSGTDIQKQAYSIIYNQMEGFVNNYLNQILKSVDKIQGDSKQLDIKSYLDKVKKANTDFLKQVESLTQAKKNGVSLVEVEFKSLQQQIKKAYKQLEKALSSEESTKDILASCKELADGLSAGIGASNYLGDIGEALAMIAAKKLVKDLFKQVKILGQETSKRGINETHFEGIIDIEDLAGTSAKYGPYTLTAEAEKQDLVDVAITLDNGRSMNLSVKARKPNASGGYRIGFAIANVLELLQNENGDDFINHFLNLNGLEDFKDEEETKNINDLVKKIILAKMVAGYNREVASGDYSAVNYFVVIDNKNYISYVVPMSRLLKYIFANGMHNKVPIPTGILEANERIEGDGGIIIRLNNVMKRLAVPSKVSYNFTPTILQEAQKQKK